MVHLHNNKPSKHAINFSWNYQPQFQQKKLNLRENMNTPRNLKRDNTKKSFVTYIVFQGLD